MYKGNQLVFLDFIKKFIEELKICTMKSNESSDDENENGKKVKGN